MYTTQSICFAFRFWPSSIGLGRFRRTRHSIYIFLPGSTTYHHRVTCDTTRFIWVKVCCRTICFPFLISHFYLHKSSNHTFINSQRLKSNHRVMRQCSVVFPVLTVRQESAIISTPQTASTRTPSSPCPKKTRRGWGGSTSIRSLLYGAVSRCSSVIMGGRLAKGEERFGAVEELLGLRRVSI